MTYDQDKINQALLLNEEQEKKFERDAIRPGFDMSMIWIATAFFIALFVVGVVTQKSLNFWAPNKPAPTSGVVISEPAATPTPVPAYPEVYVKKSSDPTVAPGPLPPGPAENNNTMIQPESASQPMPHPN